MKKISFFVVILLAFSVIFPVYAEVKIEIIPVSIQKAVDGFISRYDSAEQPHQIQRIVTKIDSILPKIKNLKTLQVLNLVRECLMDRLNALEGTDQSILSDGLEDYNSGVALDNEGDYEGAIEAYDRAITVNTTDYRYFYNKGSALSALSRHEEAIVEYDSAIALAPEFAPAYTNKAGSLAESGNADAALQVYDQVLAMKGTDENTIYGKSVAAEGKALILERRQAN